MTPERARAFWIVEPGRGEIRDTTVTAEPGDVVVRTQFSGISRGTELLVFNGRVPRSEYERMRAPFQDGVFPAPVKYGYSNVGVIERGPDAWIGRHAFVLFPHQTRYAVRESAIYLLPDNVAPARAVLAANLETAINGIWDAGLTIGDRVAVVGGGVVGCLIAWLAAHVVGCRVELADINGERSAIATSLGAVFREPASLTPDADVVFHASGSPDGLSTALATAAFEATVVEMSWYGDRMVAAALGESFHARRLTLKSSQVGHVAALKRARWDHRRRMTLALELLADPVLDLLITGESPFAELPLVMATLASASGSTLCHRIRYS